MRNAGYDPTETLDKMTHLDIRLVLSSDSYGFNSATGAFGDLYAMGIVDPAKVVITALTKAASIGALLLTTEVLVSDIPEPRRDMTVPRAY